MFKIAHPSRRNVFLRLLPAHPERRRDIPPRERAKLPALRGVWIAGEASGTRFEIESTAAFWATRYNGRIEQCKM